MTEDVIQYIWQTQSFNKSELKSTAREPIIVLSQGSLNQGSGPDFSDAKVKIDNITWSGDVEIHTYASHWDAHQHNTDSNYNRVILHVVWEDDKKIVRSDGSSIPTLELKQYLDSGWYARYQHLMSSIDILPCEKFIGGVDSILIQDAVHSALIKRIDDKSGEVLEILDDYKGDWEQTAQTWLFSGFGFSKNKEAFRQLAGKVDLKLLRKLTSLLEIEAYLFGLSGLLVQSTGNEYSTRLKETYQWIRKKNNIESNEMSVHWWKFMRMRPSNFPTRRIAQLASLLLGERNFLRSMVESDVQSLSRMFEIKHSEFWQNNYHFNSKSEANSAGIGEESKRILLINIVAPLLVAYGKAMQQSRHIKKAIRVLELEKPESNKIIRLWKGFDVIPGNASESQGLIELYNNYCKKSRCLSCSIGRHILNSG